MVSESIGIFKNMSFYINTQIERNLQKSIEFVQLHIHLQFKRKEIFENAKPHLNHEDNFKFMKFHL